MFEQIPNQEPEDIFAAVEKKSTPPATPASAPEIRPRPMPSSEPVLTPKTPFFSSYRRTIMAIVIAAVGLGVVGLGGTIVYQQFMAAPTPIDQATPEPEATLPQAPEINTNVNTENTNTEIPAVTSPAPVSTGIDSDNDGLTDNEEAISGTSPNNPDTDGDGLTDREEVNVYKTNPLKPDTDGDGYLDGAEVKAGYNPNGPGKLLPTPQL
jgi:hypothetical protein